ncbi:cell division protein FtsZ [Methanotrichaceae archaeon M04Ac]|jgi:cell division protein FtsZ|uniref:Cell division protein FtsZ n=1 Tax=Candidatus Methanocrinis alkalitolerans TaxID=3033395 RepID=A0ABT5XF09_9EURY|nr:cell division protein FtsZ [Candidatus Methanocrinis alkalitolerans]MDF0593300.1 cell division protein FtsZ [Candidatus Methanocrinis alkalitolerans]
MAFEPGGAFRSEEICYSYDGEEFSNPRILVVGCEDAGCRMAARLANLGVTGADILTAKVDRSRIDGIGAGKKILVGESVVGGGGAGVGSDTIPTAARGPRPTIEVALRDADLVFVVADLGGGTRTGTHTARAVCRMAKDLGKMAVAIFTLSPRSGGGGGSRSPFSPLDIDGLTKAANILILLDIERVFEMAPGLSTDQAISVMDQVAAEIVKGIAETVTKTSLINLDYADLKTIISSGGLSAALVGESDSAAAAEEIVQSALRSPMADVDMRGATGCLLHITGGSDLSLKKVASVASALTGEMGPGANVIWGARVKEGFEGKMRVIAIMTGVGLSARSCLREARRDS